MGEGERERGRGREIGEGEEEEEEEEEEICLITCAAVRSLPTLWSCSYGPVTCPYLAISRMDFVVSVIAYLGCDWLSPLSVQDSHSSPTVQAILLRVIVFNRHGATPYARLQAQQAELCRIADLDFLVTYLARAAPA